MKSIFIAVALVAIVATACQNEADSVSTNKKEDTALAQEAPSHQTSPSNPGSTENGAMHKMFWRYLQIKNALVNDNGKDAATAANAFVASMENMQKTTFTANQKKTWDDLSDDAKEMAVHIGKNADKPEHQREHFDMLSKDMYDLVKTFGAGQTLYQDFCPMYNHNKGATWLSEIKEIKNPYMGKKQPSCGQVKEEIK